MARGMPAMVYEAGVAQRTVLIEFDSVEQAIAAHDSPAYQEALAAGSFAAPAWRRQLDQSLWFHPSAARTRRMARMDAPTHLFTSLTRRQRRPLEWRLE
jgi:hypothetical protein